MRLKMAVMFLGLVIVFSGFSLGSREDGTMATPDGSGSSEGEMDSGSLIDYTSLEDARMTAENGPAILFFNATWCPTCREAVEDIASRPGDLGDITVIMVDYDKERDLKRRYGVTMQHTYVQIDKNGEAVTLWNGGSTDLILANVSRMGNS